MKMTLSHIMLILFILPMMSFGQEQEQGEWDFKDEADEIGRYIQFGQASMVLVKEGTADELYESTMDWVLETFVNPEKVIVSDKENEYIKVRGISEKYLFYPKYGVFANLKYLISFKFKDGKMKMTIEQLSMIVASPYSVGSTTNTDRMHYSNFNKKGKEKINEPMLKFTKISKQHFNDLSDSLLSYEGIKSSDNDW